MWVFGYGSLMWDGWETKFGCTRKVTASIRGFRRDFNKASVQNWGSDVAPCPTLGLTPSAEGECAGLVFEFPETDRDRFLAFLRHREGSSFAIEEMEVRLESGAIVKAFVAVNDRSSNTFIGDRPLQERARLARTARGKSGACLDYVKGIHDKLRELEIRDPGVEEFWLLVSGEPQNNQMQRTRGTPLAANLG